jgi:hypothetical protein
VRRAALPIALVLVFAGLVVLRIHGFSISAWHAVIDGSAPAETWVGAPRAIRSDDWRVQLPLALGQLRHEPRFPRSNDRVGLGQSALLPVELPVADPLAVFHPTMWGFFLGGDAGMAWLWWSRSLGLFAVWTAVFRIVTRGRLALSAAGAAALCFAPFFQFWSFNAAPQAAGVGLAFVATVALARAERPTAIAAGGLLLAFAGGCFALALYPPFQVPLAWLYLALVAGFWLDARRELELRRHGLWRALALATAAAVVLAAVASFAWEAHDAIELMRHTAYPGLRAATGGDRAPWQLLNANLAAPLWASDWGPLYNVCEAASFWLFAPVAVALWAWRYAAGGEGLDRFAAPVAALWAALAIYAVFGFPGWLARASLLSLAPGRRAVVGLGLADAVLVMRFLACSAPAAAAERRRTIVLAAAWALALAACGIRLQRQLPDARLAILLALAAANGGLAAWLLAARRRTLPALALAAASLATTAWFNPIAVGGADYLEGNALSRRILAIDREAGGHSSWLVFGSDELADLFHALGVRSLNGTLTLPQLELFARLDPNGAAKPIYNRYAHVAFVATPDPQPVFKLHSRDYVIVRIHPARPELRALGATHALFRGDDRARAAFERLAGYEYLGSVGDNHIYRVPPLPEDAAPEPRSQ